MAESKAAQHVYECKTVRVRDCTYIFKCDIFVRKILKINIYTMSFISYS